MLKCKVHSYFCSLWFTSLLLLLLQDVSSAAPTEDQSVPCSITVSEPVSSLDSISLTVNTPGRDCSFILTSLDAGADNAECRRSSRGDEELETNEIGGREQAEEEVKERQEKEKRGANYLGTNQLGVEEGGDEGVEDVFTCVLDHLEPGTAYQLQVQSQKDEETTNLTLHTRPSAVSGLAVTSQDLLQPGSFLAGWARQDAALQAAAVGTTSELGSLRSAEKRDIREHGNTTHTCRLDPGTTVQCYNGDLDALTITLSTNGTSRWETTLAPDATEAAIDQLTPGSPYQVSVTSRSGKLTSQSEITVSTAPAAASLLSLSPSSEGLLLSWIPPAGHWESYTLFLFDGPQQLVSTCLDQEAVKFIFPGTSLTPGRMYKAVLRVESGGLTAESSCEGSTAPAPVLDLHIRHSDETSLSAMWSHAPSGSRDSYFLTIHH
ncbi:receptor-type tyrosine-protein phosphatase beta-like protein, partial [Lates japonicus]